MSNTIEIQTLLDELNHQAESLFKRGPMYGSFPEQEATLYTLLTIRDFTLRRHSPTDFFRSARYQICQKHKMNSVLPFYEQLKGKVPYYLDEQEYFSKILRELWEFDEHE